MNNSLIKTNNVITSNITNSSDYCWTNTSINTFDWTKYPGVYYPTVDIEAIMKEFKRIEGETKMDKKKMYVYEIIIVDRRACEIVNKTNVIAPSEKLAIAMLELSKEDKAKLAKNELELIVLEVGSFEKIETKE